MWDKIFNRDQFLAGILFGILLPAVFYLALRLLDMGVYAIFQTNMVALPEYLYILSLAINLFAIKYYFVNLKYDKTGRGVLIVTFAFALIYFVLY